MLRTESIYLPILASAIFSVPAYAEDWATGFGETVTEATENSLSNAKAAVASQGSGCIGSKDGTEDTRLRPEGQVEAKEYGIWVVQTYYSHHNGSCNKNSKDQIWVEDQVSKLIGG